MLILFLRRCTLMRVSYEITSKIAVGAFTELIAANVFFRLLLSLKIKYTIQAMNYLEIPRKDRQFKYYTIHTLRDGNNV